MQTVRLCTVLKRLDAERERLTAGLPHAQSVVLPVDESSCVLAADLLAIQKYIVTGMLPYSSYLSVMVLLFARLR